MLKLSSFKGLELYRTSNEYRRKAEEIRGTNEANISIDNLRKVGMGKESLKEIMRWLNEEKHLKISKKLLIEQLEENDIPEEIKSFFHTVKSAMQ